MSETTPGLEEALEFFFEEGLNEDKVGDVLDTLKAEIFRLRMLVPSE